MISEIRLETGDIVPVGVYMAVVMPMVMGTSVTRTTGSRKRLMVVWPPPRLQTHVSQNRLLCCCVDDSPRHALKACRVIRESRWHTPEGCAL